MFVVVESLRTNNKSFKQSNGVVCFQGFPVSMRVIWWLSDCEADFCWRAVSYEMTSAESRCWNAEGGGRRLGEMLLCCFAHRSSVFLNILRRRVANRLVLIHRTAAEKRKEIAKEKTTYLNNQCRKKKFTCLKVLPLTNQLLSTKCCFSDKRNKF